MPKQPKLSASDLVALTNMYRVGKKHAGNELNGQRYEEYPEVTA